MTNPTDPTEPEITTSQNGLQHPIASIDAFTTLIHSVGSMMAAMERRITDRINDNAAASKERWTRWEEDFRDYRKANDERVGTVEGRVGRLERRDEHQQTVWDARIGPLRNIAAIMGRNWRNLVILGFALLGAAGLAQQVLENGLHMLGSP